MRLRVLLIGILFTTQSLRSYCQQYSNEQIHEFENQERIFYYYRDTLLGCGYATECRGFTVEFGILEFDKTTKLARITGNVYDLSKDRPIPNTEIFLAKKNIDTLIDKILLYTTKKMDVNLPYDMGKFDVSFEVKENLLLYVSHPSYRLIEFDIYRLIMSCVNKQPKPKEKAVKKEKMRCQFTNLHAG